MSKKIVVIGAGKSEIRKANRFATSIGTEFIDREIIRLTAKERPNFLFMEHSQRLKKQNEHFEILKEIYSTKYNCECKILSSSVLKNKEKVMEMIEWADIIYSGNGNIESSIELWRQTGFDNILKYAWGKGKVLCGFGTGGISWFNGGIYESSKDDSINVIETEALELIDGFLIPGCEKLERQEVTKQLLKGEDKVCIFIPNYVGLEIINKKYRVMFNKETCPNTKRCVVKSYYKEGQYYEEIINCVYKYKTIKKLLDPHFNDK